MRCTTARSARGGFTLSEVAVATTIVGVGLAALMVSVESSTRINDVGGKLAQATFLAQEIRAPYRHRALSAADYAAIVQAQVDELQSFIVQDQAMAMSAQASRNGNMSAQDLDFPPLPPGGDDGGTNIWQDGGTTFNGRTPGTNDLWLQILSVSNSTARPVDSSALERDRWDLRATDYDSTHSELAIVATADGMVVVIGKVGVFSPPA